MVNQQGTLKKDTSETICIENFDRVFNKAFINWFIGYVEGNENVFIVNRRYLRFELNCFIRDINIIKYIKKKLNFGSIRYLRFVNSTIVEFSVQSSSDSSNIIELLKLVYIFNGNFRSTAKEQQFLIFYKKLKIKLKKMDLSYLLPEYNNNIKTISFNDSWFLGYIDSRGFFYARWKKSKKYEQGKIIYLCCIFWNLQEELLIKIKTLLDSVDKIENKFKWNLPFYKLTLENFEKKKKIVDYLLKYKLKSLKRKRFKYWCLLLDLEYKYLKTGYQDLDHIDKILIKFNSTINADELSKI